MLGLFGLLGLGSRSLDVQQQASEVTGQNLANVNNPAYARQRLNVQTSPTISSAMGPEGTGVMATGIQQVRDALLDSQVASEASVNSSLSTQQSALQNAEAALGEQLNTQTAGANGANSTTDTAGQTGLSDGIANFFAAVQTLSTEPTSIAQRQVVLDAAQQLASRFNQVSAGLNTVQIGLNQSIKNDVDSANQDLSDIASLNQQIVTTEQSGGTANDLRDLRQQKLEDLAKLTNFGTTTEANGSIDISIENTALVVGGNFPNKLAVFDPGNGNYTIQASTGIALTLTGGSIQGSISARDGALASLQSHLNTLANQIITNVNGIIYGGYNLYGANGGSGQPLFTGTNAVDIGVSSQMLNDPNLLPASGVAGAAGDNSVALKVAQLGEQGNVALNNQTFGDAYSSYVSDLGSAISTVNDQLTNSNAVTKMLTNQRASVSGVSLDEEMTNLMQYQKSYQASAELITTVNQMLATLIAMKTV